MAPDGFRWRAKPTCFMSDLVGCLTRLIRVGGTLSIYTYYKMTLTPAQQRIADDKRVRRREEVERLLRDEFEDGLANAVREAMAVTRDLTAVETEKSLRDEFE
jgi:hypothetical protein